MKHQCGTRETGAGQEKGNYLMSRIALTLTATTALTMLTGTAVGATHSYPNCIASPQEQDLNDIATRMFNLMPKAKVLARPCLTQSSSVAQRRV